MSNQTKNSSWGINIVGHITGEFGLGESVRTTIRSIESAKIPFILKNVEVDWHRNSDHTYVDYLSAQNPYPINLVTINPEGDLHKWIGDQYYQNRYNIGYWSWELPKLKPTWEPAFELFDEIWTPSNYSADAISMSSPIPVIKIPHSISLSKPSLTRQDLGLPTDKFIFLFMFDLHSTLERKNPLGTIEAFKQAFGEANQDVMLIIKFSNAEYHPERKAQLQAQIEGWSSIKFIEGHLMKEEVHALINNCNCYVSLHRAEGFGLTMAEAMFYGKPVIATGYSANIEFMNIGNSFLVKYKLISVPQEAWYHQEGVVWADPDIDHAASLLRYVFDNYQQALQVGAKAAQDVQSLLNPQAIGEKVRNRLEQITKTVDNLYQLRVEKEYLESQAKAWKEAARQVQVQLKSLKSKGSLVKM